MLVRVDCDNNPHPDNFIGVLSLNLPGIIYQEIPHVIYLQEYFLLFYLVLLIIVGFLVRNKLNKL